MLLIQHTRMAEGLHDFQSFAAAVAPKQHLIHCALLNHLDKAVLCAAFHCLSLAMLSTAKRLCLFLAQVLHAA